MPKKHMPINLEYLKYLREDSLLSAKDIKEIFGFSSTRSVASLVCRGKFPKYDIEHNDVSGIFGKPKRPHKQFWKKQTVIDAINKINEERT